MIEDAGIVVIGGSAGSLTVLLQVLPQLHNDLSFPIVIVLHRKPYPESVLNDLLANCTALEVHEAEDKMTIKPGAIYIVPPDYHLLFENQELVSLDFSEKLNYSRPSIDITFQSAGEIFLHRTVAILLSGANADGVNGLREIKQYQGTVIVQDPKTADIDYMPRQAILNVEIDEVLAPGQIATFINQLSI